jgi:lysine/ornithine N-monooxygenase
MAALLELATARGDIQARNVVVATGPFQAPKIPLLSRELPSDLFQIHSRDYRNPSQLPRGATLVVGSGASGTQIAEELHRGGRKVILAVGRFHKTPRRYRGRDFGDVGTRRGFTSYTPMCHRRPPQRCSLGLWPRPPHRSLGRDTGASAVCSLRPGS